MSERLRVLILGASGMLGHTLLKFLEAQPDLEVWATCRKIPAGLASIAKSGRIMAGVDVEQHDHLVAAMRRASPAVVINCVGVIKQLQQAYDPLYAVPINSLLPHRIAALCELMGGRLVQISTDCVYAGLTGGYTEDVTPDATDLYGRSKLLGEVISPPHITLRTSIIGHELDSRVSLVDWFLSQSGPVKGFRNAIFSGLPTVELAKVIYQYVLRRPDLTGLFHVSVDPIDKFSLLRIIAQRYGFGQSIVPVDEPRIDRSLDSRRFREATGYTPLSWSNLIEAMHASRE